ncbi:Arylsulfatase A [Monaibacterium marinum]|uniref:Arylsulfatase A n=1 Tax=Pontivivens marinum TaxID=1690039 RepID=A0A2C9CRE5_9RHOB|nr:sulfatase-like hydrolase/transferase [Monaibacterium marinum]SOH93924.1 Arylsulfatase A [Monaibacterium marinum]
MKNFLTLLVLALPAATPIQAAPNVLIIIADDMGLDASRCYAVGQQQATMPNIEALCDTGVVFENAYAAPVCSPTRATIMTGQYGFRTGVGATVSRNGENGLSSDMTSLFDVVSGAGYSSNLIGKWHLAGAEAGLDHPSEFGVSDYWGLFSGTARNYSRWTSVANEAEVRVNEYSTTAFTNRAIDWIGAQDGPWFLWLAYNAPHAPFHLPPAELHTAHDLLDSRDAIAANPLPYYNAMLQALDTEIGRLFASMDPETRENTIVIFLGDNGSPNQVTRGFYGDHRAKGSIYEGGTHVPLIVAGPDVQAGRSDDFVTTTDLFATIAGLTGAQVSMPDSYDFGPVLTGGQSARDYIYVEHFAQDGPSRGDMFGHALRQNDYKLVLEQGAQPELYNLAIDPREATDLLADGVSADEAAIVARLTARIDVIRGE